MLWDGFGGSWIILPIIGIFMLFCFLLMFGMMFMFIVIVAPVLMTTLVVAMGIAMKGLPVSAEVMYMLYGTFFGIGIFMSIMIKRMEPRA